MVRIGTRVVAALIAVAGLACGGGSSSPTAPSANVPFSATDLRVGTGAEAVNGRLVNVNYTGWLYDSLAPANKGTQFDSSAGRAPLPFTLGTGSVIAGFDRGVLGMRVGGQRRVVIPPDLGYGSQPRSGIPGNSTLIFEIELLSVQ